MVPLAPCVITPGTIRMPQLSAISWDSLAMVCTVMSSYRPMLPVSSTHSVYSPQNKQCPILLPCSSCSSVISHPLIGAIAIPSDFFSDNNITQLVSNVQCLGSEMELLDCMHDTYIDSTCTDSTDASAVCQGDHNTNNILT